MKKIKLLFAILLVSNMGLNAQINLIGAAYNPSTQMIDIVKWQALDSGSVITIPSILEAYYFGSSAFDAYNGNYYLTGITADDQGLFSFNTQTNEQDLSEFTSFSNVSEFDMSTGKIYDLRLDSPEYISVNEFDIKTGTDSLIGVIYEPGANAIVADAIGFNSNDGIIYYVGFTNEPAICLYAISVRDEVFSFSRTSLLPTAPYNILTGVNYDNVKDKIFALNNYILTSITDNAEIDFRVFPNPATDRLRLNVNSGEDVLVRIYSTNGNLVLSKEFSEGENIELHLDFLQSGPYLVNVLSGGMNGSKKIQVL